jgi:hypothetical protein
MAPPYIIPKPMSAPKPNRDPDGIYEREMGVPPPKPAWTQAQMNKWMDARARATLRLSAWEHQLRATCESWQVAARQIGSAYATAAKNHNDALAKQAQIDALETQAIFSVLTIATSGAFSWASSGLALAEQFPERKLLVEAVQGAAEAGIGEGFSALGPMVFSQTNSSVSIDPLQFQNDRENAVSEAKKKVDERFAKIDLEWASADLNEWDGYDEKKQRAELDDLLRQAGTLAGEEDLPSPDDMAEELERGIWAQWMPQLKRVKYYASKAGGGPKDDYASVGSAIEKRLDKLGILDMADVTIHWYHSAEPEDRKLIAWAQGYKVKEFQSMRKK